MTENEVKKLVAALLADIPAAARPAAVTAVIRSLSVVADSDDPAGSAAEVLHQWTLLR